MRFISALGVSPSRLGGSCAGDVTDIGVSSVTGA